MYWIVVITVSVLNWIGIDLYSRIHKEQNQNTVQL